MSSKSEKKRSKKEVEKRRAKKNKGELPGGMREAAGEDFRRGVEAIFSKQLDVRREEARINGQGICIFGTLRSTHASGAADLIAPRIPPGLAKALRVDF